MAKGDSGYLFLMFGGTGLLQTNGSSLPDSIPPSDRRWLLVAWSADFADVGPTVDFYARWRRATIGDFVILSKK